MSKFLDKDGLAHLWERIQELVATCGGGESKSVEVPQMSSMLDAVALGYGNSTALTLDGTTTTSGTVTLTANDVKPTNYFSSVIIALRSTANQNIFEKMTGYEIVSGTGVYTTLKLYFASTEPFTIAASTIEADSIAFFDRLVNKTDICYVKGSCSSEGGGGDINV